MADYFETEKAKTKALTAAEKKEYVFLCSIVRRDLRRPGSDMCTNSYVFPSGSRSSETPSKPSTLTVCSMDEKRKWATSESNPLVYSEAEASTLERAH